MELHLRHQVKSGSPEVTNFIIKKSRFPGDGWFVIASVLPSLGGFDIVAESYLR
jgi:hypothetical protein